MSDYLTQMVQDVVSIASDKKALQSTVYKPYDTSFSDFIILVVVQNAIQLKAISDDMDASLSRSIAVNGQGYHPKQSGVSQSGWVVLDTGSMVVHVISEPVLEYFLLHDFFVKQAVVHHF